MTPPPSPKNPAPKPGSPPPAVRFALPTGAIWLSMQAGTQPPPALLAAGISRRGLRDGGGWVPLADGGQRAWVKGGRLSRKSALRHGASRVFLHRHAPRLAEMGNLLELSKRGVPAAEPLLAGVERGRLGQPTMQFLATLEVTGSVDLEAMLAMEATTKPQREQALVAAGQLASQMHQAGFVHRNYFLRNLVLQPGGRLTILDPWRGSFAAQPKCHVVDLTDFLGDASPVLRPHEVERFLDSYRAASAGALSMPSASTINAATAFSAQRIEARRQKRASRRS